MNRSRAFLAFLSALVIVACGGGGGGGGTVPSGVRVNLTPKNPSVVKGGTVNFFASVSNAANTSVTFSANKGSFTSVTANSAIWNAPNTVGSATVTATSNQDGSASDSTTVTITGGASVTGRVIDDLLVQGIAGVELRFFNNVGNLVASATTNVSGNFTVGMPPSAVSFRITSASIPPAYYQQWEFKGLRYSPIIAGCDAPLPAIPDTGIVSLGNIRLTPTTQPPPPPPNGCQ